MSPAAYALLTDYARRTLGFWILLTGVQFVQASILWANRPGRIPLVGSIIAGITFFVTFESTQSVIRTLPLTARDLSLVRWWMQIGLPAIIVTASLTLSWWVNEWFGGSAPPQSHLLVATLCSLTTLGALRSMPVSMLSAARSNLPRFGVIWSLLTVAALYGYPAESLPRALTICVAGLGVVLAIVHLAGAHSMPIPYASESCERHVRPRVRTAGGMQLRGWAVLFAELLRSTVLMSVVGVLGTSLLRRLMPYLDQPALAAILPIAFVSIVGIYGSLIARSWLQALPALQCLPVRAGHLAIILCLVLLAPGFTACAIASIVHSFAPALGLVTPLYALPVLAIVPALSIPWTNLSRRSPLLQLATWPLWTGSFGALALTKLLPSWFSTLALPLTAACCLSGYFAILARIRRNYSV